MNRGLNILLIEGLEYSCEFVNALKSSDIHIERIVSIPSDSFLEMNYSLTEFDICFYAFSIAKESDFKKIELLTSNKIFTPIVLLAEQEENVSFPYFFNLGVYDCLFKTAIDKHILYKSIYQTLDRYKCALNFFNTERKLNLLIQHATNFIFSADEKCIIQEHNDFNIYHDVDNKMVNLKGVSLFDVIDDESSQRLKEAVQSSKSIINEIRINFQPFSAQTRPSLLSLVKVINPQTLTYVWQGIIEDNILYENEINIKLLDKQLVETEKIIGFLVHEIRNPLTNIRLSTDGIIFENKSNELDFYLDIIKKNIDRINLIINELLNSYKKVELKKEKVRLQEILDLVIDNVSDRAKLLNIDIEKYYHDECLYSEIDKERFILALTNICLNGIEALFKENSILKVYLFKEDDIVFIVIEDNGIGMNEEQLNRLFEPFFSKKIGGLGVGLKLSLNILKAHKCRLYVSSNQNIGSKFVIEM